MIQSNLALKLMKFKNTLNLFIKLNKNENEPLQSSFPHSSTLIQSNSPLPLRNDHAIFYT